MLATLPLAASTCRRLPRAKRKKKQKKTSHWRSAGEFENRNFCDGRRFGTLSPGHFSLACSLVCSLVCSPARSSVRSFACRRLRSASDDGRLRLVAGDGQLFAAVVVVVIVVVVVEAAPPVLLTLRLQRCSEVAKQRRAAAASGGGCGESGGFVLKAKRQKILHRRTFLPLSTLPPSSRLLLAVIRRHRLFARARAHFFVFIIFFFCLFCRCRRRHKEDSHNALARCWPRNRN